ncbi:hypothetical protein SSP24_42260 [Streptomyces spinoverrucosus]|uniref:Uncharacterized protein n=1 Tax=Streptomyces spinoverrucosus TaxID=284043 RepID=A0A4Y3VLG7_9ACTN|nr:hypothetical protein [Streptomyces spinoverrucosus]GEC06571.1 hypothetical protein SSP24_42260 [Streptomyces spinoverrucosus]GHB54258.1 hypothetical protein GCM10010397_25590 [Streptomyces spinoverrucosus]
MTDKLSRRVAPVLLLLQVAYVALLTVAFTVLPPDTAELDQPGASAMETAFVPVATLGIIVALAGAAALLGLEKARTRAPRVVRVVWLALVALGQLAIAAKALLNVLSQTPGPDTGIGAGMIVVALCVAVACAVEARGSSASPSNARVV